MTRTMGLWAAAILATAAAVVGASALREPGAVEGPRPTWVEAQTTGTTGEASREAAGVRPVQPSEEAAVEPAGPPTSRPSAGTRQPANASASGTRTPEPWIPPAPGTPGPPVSYRDDAGDADGLAPYGALNQPAFDILRVGWAPASHVDDQLTRGYATSITIAGAASDDGSYVSYGEFYSDVPGETCQLYHFLTPGATAFANAFCGSIDAGTRRFVGAVQGGRVRSTSTMAGGTVLVATFDDSALPAFVEAGGRMLWELSAFTCSEPMRAAGCTYVDDHAASRVDYQL